MIATTPAAATPRRTPMAIPAFWPPESKCDEEEEEVMVGKGGPAEGTDAGGVGGGGGEEEIGGVAADAGATWGVGGGADGA